MSESTFICSAKRTAIGSFGGALSTTPAPILASELIKSIISETKLSGDEINEVILGCVLTAGNGQAPTRQALIFSGLPKSVQAMTINKVCSSGLKAVMLAIDQIALKKASAILAGGMENMSLAPYIMPALRNGARLGHVEAKDTLIYDALWDVYNNFHMGSAAEICARKYNLTREMQDAFAIESYKRANSAIRAGHFKDEICPIKIKAGKDEILFDTDEEPPRGKPEKIPSLKPVFEKDGTVTAANASSINDGACLMLVCSESFAKKNNLEPLCRVISQGWHACEPEWFTTAPVGAVNHALKNANLEINDIDLFEINEAFSAVALACQQELKIPSDKLNINGGAVALGHPVGASGARILTTLLHSLKRLNLKRGVVGICNGGGEATALVVERV